MNLQLCVELFGASDAHLFVAVCKLRGSSDGDNLPFEGSYGFGRDVVAKGWQRIAHRRIDSIRSEPYRPFHPHCHPEPLNPGEVARVEIEILPSATYFARGDILRVDVQGRWFWKRNQFFGMFPAAYAPSPRARMRLHMGDDCDSQLLIPQAR